MQPIVLKITLLLALMFGAQATPAQGVDLSRTVTLPSAMQTRAVALRAVDATGYNVVYNPDTLDAAAVDFGATTLSLRLLLDKVTDGTSLAYTLDGNHIIVHPVPSKQEQVAAGQTLSGTVKCGDGNVLTNAAIELLDRSDKRARTDADGRFRIADIPSGHRIVKITPSDGSPTRYREVTIPAGRDVHAVLTLDEIVIPAAAPQAVETPRATQTTTYFHPTPEPPASGRVSRYLALPEPQKEELYLPKAGVKTNLLYLGTTTPNVAVEFGLAPRWTLDASIAFNPFRLDPDGVNRLWFVQPEVRYWFCQRFEKSFVGLHGIYGQFNIGQVDFLTDTFRDHRYTGWGAGVGISYGYHLPMGKRWAWEFTVGVGYVYLEYNKYRCQECDEFIARKNRHYFGPTKAGISLIFMIQ